MKQLFDSADRYLKASSWKDLTLIKFCLFSMGLLLGQLVPEKHKKTCIIAAAFVFILTYIPLMAKYFTILFQHDET